MMIDYSHGSQNCSNGIWSRGAGFRANCWRLDITLSWLFSWFIIMKDIGFIHIYPETGWEETRTTNGA